MAVSTCTFQNWFLQNLQCSYLVMDFTSVTANNHSGWGSAGVLPKGFSWIVVQLWTIIVLPQKRIKHTFPKIPWSIVRKQFIWKKFFKRLSTVSLSALAVHTNLHKIAWFSEKKNISTKHSSGLQVLSSVLPTVGCNFSKNTSSGVPSCSVILCHWSISELFQSRNKILRKYIVTLHQ